MPSAVIFDVDGTLVDSVDLHAKAWQEAFRDYGHEIPFEDIRSQIGKGGDQLMPVFLSQNDIDASGDGLEEHRRAQALFWRAAADLLLDRIDRRDPPQRLGGNRRLVADMLVEELAPRMREARRLDHPVAIQSGEPGIAVGLQDASELAQVLTRMLALAIGPPLLATPWRSCAVQLPYLVGNFRATAEGICTACNLTRPGDTVLATGKRLPDCPPF